MPGVNDWTTKTLFHDHKEPKTAFNKEVFDRLTAEGYHEGYKHQEYPLAMYGPNYHETKRILTAKDAKAKEDLMRKGWRPQMPPVPDTGADTFDIVDDFTKSEEVAREMKKYPLPAATPAPVAQHAHAGQATATKERP